MTIVGRLKVKVVPDASGFQRDADKQMRKILRDLSKDLKDPSTKLGKSIGTALAAGLANTSFKAGRTAGARVSAGVRSQMPSALKQIQQNFTTPLGKQLTQQLSSQLNRNVQASLNRSIIQGFGNGQAIFAKLAPAAARAGQTSGRAWFRNFLGQSGRAQYRAGTVLQQAATAAGFTLGGPLSGISSTLALMGGKAAVAGGAVALLGTAISGVVAASAGLTVGAAAFGAFSYAALRSAGALEQQGIAFATLLKSQDKGGAFLDQVIDFAKNTPFDVGGVADGAKRLLAYGNAAEDVLPLLTDLGDATSALGLGTDGLNRLILAFGQIKASGRLYRTEIRQLTEAGIPVWDILGDKLGKTKEELDAMLESGLDAETAITALRDGMSELYGGSMQAQAKSFLGTVERIKESLTIGFSQEMLTFLPGISAAVRDLAPSLELASTTLGRGLGASLTQFLTGIEPATRRASVTLSTLLPSVMRDWTPAYTTITDNLSKAFSAAEPGLRALSGALASFAAGASNLLTPFAEQFSAVMVGADNLRRSLTGITDAIPNVANIDFGILSQITRAQDVAGRLTAILGLVPSLVLKIRAALAEFAADLLNLLAVTFDNLPGGLGDGIAESLRGAAATAMESVPGLLSESARLALPVDVQLRLEDIEASLADLDTRVGQLPIGLQLDVDRESLRAGSIEALQGLADLPPVELKNVGIDPAALEAQIADIQAFLDSLPPEVRTTISADTAAAQAQVSELRSELEKEWSVAVSTGNVDSLLSKAAAANQVLQDAGQALAIYNSSTGTAKLFADATQAEQELALAQGKVFQWDATTGTSTLLTRDEASAIIAQVQAAMAAYDAAVATGDVNAIDNASAVLAEVSARIGGIPRYVPVTIEARISNPNGFSDARELALLGGGRAAPAGGSVPIGAGVARDGSGDGLTAGGGVSSRAASLLPSMGVFVGRWVEDLRRIVTEVRKAAQASASEIADALGRVYDMEIWTRRRLEIERTNFARRQEDEDAYIEAVLRAREKGVEGAALEALQASHEAQLRQWRRFQQDKARDFEWQLENEQIFYDKQKALADEFVARLKSIQDRARSIVDWGEITSPSALIRNLQRSTEALTRFATDLTQLQRLGLSDAAQEALEAISPEEASRIARRLLDDPALIGELNKAYADFLTAGVTLSDSFTDPVAAAGAVVGKSFSTGLNSAVSTVASRSGGGAGVVVNQQIHPSARMDERELAAAAARELMWKL